MTGEPPRAAALHVHSSYSLLDGVDTPADLVEEAARLGLSAMAITDHDSLAAVPTFANAARGRIPTVFGVELNLGLPGSRTGMADPPGEHLLVLVRDADAYRRLSAVITEANLAGGAKGHPVYDLDAIAEASRSGFAILTGCRKGAVPAALAHGGIGAAETALRSLLDRFGTANVNVELTRHGQPGDDRRCDQLAELAERFALPTVASDNVHYARPAEFRTYAALAALRARRTLADLDSWLPAGPVAHLSDPGAMARRYARYPGALARTAKLAESCVIDFDRQIRPGPPRFPVPAGETEDGYLRTLVEAGMLRRYGERAARPDAWRQMDYELGIVAKLGFAGFFLIAWDVVRYCRAQQPPILAQGRGSAANSVIVYALHVSAVDPLKYGLLFERFMHLDRGTPPDIDIDIAADRRESVLQYLYGRYGRRNAAMVANEITLRPRFATREAARVLGYSPGAVDAMATRISSFEALPEDGEDGLPTQVLELARDLWANGSRVRHFGIHSGGVVLCSGPISDVLPVEWAAMKDRTVVTADKVSAALAGLYKTDCLGLRALDVVADVIEMLRVPGQEPMELSDFPADDDAVYDMINDGDNVGLFQLESRAQISTSGPMRARTYRDVAVQIALIRPGPGGSGASRRYLARRRGDESVPAVHPVVDAILEDTLGTVVFQEQVMEIALEAAGFSPVEADKLRKAMGSKRASAEFEALRERFFRGLAERGITGATADGVWAQIASFSGYSFPFSHSLSFAFVALATAWIKKYEPARMLCAMLRHQPMGFYAPATLIEDARRHDVIVRPVCVAASQAITSLEPLTDELAAAYRPTHKHSSPRPQPPVRLGLAEVRALGVQRAEQIVAERERGGAFESVEDFARRTELPLAALESLATAGAFDVFGADRRATLWTVGAVAGSRRGHLPDTAPGSAPPPLPALTLEERTIGELWAGPTAGVHPMLLVRERLAAIGVTAAADLAALRHGGPVTVAGLVTHRQHPANTTVTFLGLEDHSGLINVIVPAKIWAAQPRKVKQAGALIIRGTLENEDNSVSVVAGRLAPLVVAAVDRSRSYRRLPDPGMPRAPAESAAGVRGSSCGAVYPAPCGRFPCP